MHTPTVPLYIRRGHLLEEGTCQKGAPVRKRHLLGGSNCQQYSHTDYLLEESIYLQFNLVSWIFLKLRKPFFGFIKLGVVSTSEVRGGVKGPNLTATNNFTCSLCTAQNTQNKMLVQRLNRERESNLLGMQTNVKNLRIITIPILQ